MRRKSSWSKDSSPNIGGVFGLLGDPNGILVSAVGASLRPLADWVDSIGLRGLVMVVLLDPTFARMFWKSEMVVVSGCCSVCVVSPFFYVLGFLFMVFVALASRKPGLHPNGSLDASA